jgi:hypothetical protein
LIRTDCGIYHVIELAAEIKDHYPEKEVTLIHSRDYYLPAYKHSLSQMTYNMLKNTLKVRQIRGDRVQIPEGGFPHEVKPIVVETKMGKSIQTDLAVGVLFGYYIYLKAHTSNYLATDYLHRNDSQQQLDGHTF